MSTVPIKKWLKQRRKPLIQQAALDTITLEHGSIVTLVIFLKHLYDSTFNINSSTIKKFKKQGSLK